MEISLLYKNKRKYKYYCGSRRFDVLVFNQKEFLQTTGHFFVTKHKGFLMHKESPLDVALFFVL